MWRTVSMFIGACMLVGCGGMMQSLEIPVGKTESLKRGLKDQFEDFHDQFDRTKKRAGEIGEVPPGVNMKDVNPAVLKKMMMDCFTSPMKIVNQAKTDAKKTGKEAVAKKKEKSEKAARRGVANAKAGIDKLMNCPANTKDGMAAYKGKVPGTAMKFYEEKIKLVDNLRKDLMERLPKKAKALPMAALSAAKDAALLKGQSEAGFRAAQSNPMADAKAKSKAKSDHEKVDADVKEIEVIIKKMKDDGVRLPGDISGLLSKVKSDLAGFGGNF